MGRRIALAAALVVVAVTVPASASHGAARANVALQVVPRGTGTLKGGPELGGLTCSASTEPGECAWSAPAGTPVTLTASPAGGARVTWSTPDCASGSTTCSFTLDEETTVVAIFGKLTLEVATSGAGDKQGLITSNPAGISCPGTCQAKFDPGQAVTLTTQSVPGVTFTSYPYGCESTSSATCTVHVWDEPQSVGVNFNGAGGPAKPLIVTVKIRIAKAGSGAGQVTAGGSVTCGSTCTGSFEYGTLVRFTAAATGGSTFGGWGGVCAADRETTCTLPAGPITVIRPRFEQVDAAPSAPGAVTASAATETTVTLVWSSATDDRGIKAYEVYVGDETTPRESTTQRTVQLTGLECGKRYAVAVVAVDTGNNRSPRTTAEVATAACPSHAAKLTVTKLAGALAGTRVVCRFTASAAGAGSADLAAGGRRVATKAVSFAAGTNTISFAVPKAARGRVLRVTLRIDAGSWTWTIGPRR